MNAIRACAVQMNGNMWEVITVCDRLNDSWEREKKVRRIIPKDILQFYGVKNFKASGGPYFCASVTRHRFFDMNSAGRTWNDNIIWMKGVKSTVERKESLLDEVAEEETELELVLGELGLSRKKRVESRSKKVVNAQSTRSMTGVDEGKRKTSGEEVRARTPRSGTSAQPNLTTNKIVQKFLKRQIKKTLPASGTTVSGEVIQRIRRRVEPLGNSGDKVVEGRSALMDDFKEVEERARLAILQGNEDTSQIAARLVKGIWLGIEEQESELKKAKSELEKNLAQAKTDALNEVKQLKAIHAVVIGQVQVKAKANLDEMAEERDRLSRHLMLKGYSLEEVDVTKVYTYAEEEEEEAEVLGVVDDLDGVSPQIVLDNQGDNAELPEGGSEKVVREMSLRINDRESRLARERKTSKALLSAQVELQGHVQKGNVNLRECQHKLDAPLIREKVLEGEIRAKDLLVKRKDLLLKDLPAREELNAKLGRLRTQLVDLEAMNLAESAKYIAMLEADVIYHDRVDTEIIAWKDTCAML
ncbi:hypothetical protein GIB67_012586 [Kingdonia uniflora]|uniref:Uncharacterized protein n=1 Tax=Kingdonia uniflora TaxID=39325 RepID=A0A7J7NEL4_9MAGN|nr:hypothetical protein GIB67_012586 [Kingdonia uniflora]